MYCVETSNRAVLEKSVGGTNVLYIKHEWQRPQMYVDFKGTVSKDKNCHKNQQRLSYSTPAQGVRSIKGHQGALYCGEIDNNMDRKSKLGKNPLASNYAVVN